MAAMAQTTSSVAKVQQRMGQKPFTGFRIGRSAVRVEASAQGSGVASTRRQVLQLAAIPALSAVTPSAALAAGNKPPRGFNPVQDLNDNYQFLYPFGWQEVSVDGADIVYKDVVEPLESVSVTLTPTDKTDIKEFGGIQEVAETLAKEVLTAPGQEVNVVNTNERETKGRTYYEFEFTAKSPRYTRHSVAVVIADKGKFYTLTTGANERRWPKMADKLKTTVRSFQLMN